MKILDYEGLRSKGVRWSKPHIWRQEKAGNFPKRVRLGERTPGWDESEVDQWLEARKAERDRKIGTAAMGAS
jgi:prophage regulatory protein